MLLHIVILTLQVGVGVLVGCQCTGPLYTLVGSTCYHLIVADEKYFSPALEYCTNNFPGGALATPRSEEVLDAVVGLFLNNDVTYGHVGICTNITGDYWCVDGTNIQNGFRPLVKERSDKKNKVMSWHLHDTKKIHYYPDPSIPFVCQYTCHVQGTTSTSTTSSSTTNTTITSTSTTSISTTSFTTTNQRITREEGRDQHIPFKQSDNFSVDCYNHSVYKTIQLSNKMNFLESCAYVCTQNSKCFSFGINGSACKLFTEASSQNSLYLDSCYRRL